MPLKDTMSPSPDRVRRKHIKNGRYNSKKTHKGNEENEDPFSLHNPQNTPNSNTRSRNEWEANQSILSVTDSTKFSFTIDNESLYEKFKYEKLQLQKKETIRHLIPKNNQSFDIWLIIGSKGLTMVDINLYAADRVTWRQNMVEIHLNRLSHFHLSNPDKIENLSNQSKLDASIVLCGDKTMHAFFEFIQYLNVHTPGDAQMPSSFRVLVPSLKKNPRKRNRANPSGFTLDKKLVFQRMDIEDAVDNNIEHCDARNKHAYDNYLDSSHARQRQSVGNGSKHGRAQQMQAAALNDRSPANQKMAQAAMRRHQQLLMPVVSQPQSGKSKGGFNKRRNHNRRNQRPFMRSSNPRPTTILSSKYSSGRSGDQIGFKNLGNTCYLNAILRSITCIECFTTDMRRKYVIGLSGDALNGSNSLYRSYVELVFADVDNAKHKNNRKILNPRDLKTIIGSMAAMFASYRQQDAHELLSFILNAFHDEIYRAIGGKDDDTKSLKPEMDDDEDEDVEMNEDNDEREETEQLEWLSPIHCNFHFQIEFEYECTHCGYKRNKIESFREMSLDLPLLKERPKSVPPQIDKEEEGEEAQCDEAARLKQLQKQMIDKMPKGCPSHGLGEHIQFKMQKQAQYTMYCHKCNDAELESLNVTPELKHYSDRVATNPCKTSGMNEGDRDFNGNQINSWTLNELLRAYFVRKTLEYKCERDGCGNDRVFVSSWFKRIPRVLVLHMKRFIPNYCTNSYTKSHDKVAIENTLDVNLFCNQNLSVPPSSLDVLCENKENKCTNEAIMNDGNVILDRVLNGQHVFETPDACKPYRSLSDLPPKIQQKPLKSEAMNVDQDDDDDDDDVVILNTNNGSNHNTKPPMDNSVPPSIEPNNGSETLNRLETKYGPLTSHASPQPGAARVSTNAFDECSEEDMMSPQDAKAKAEFWDELLPTWREEWSKKNCESRKNSANAQTKEYCKMYLKYWKSIELHHNKTRKRKREDSGDECPPNKRPRLDVMLHKETESTKEGVLSNFGLNDTDPMDFDEKSGPLKQPKITDMFSSKQETDFDRAIAASVKSATDDERRRRKRKKCIRESDSDNDSSDQQLQQVLAQSLLIQNLSDLCNDNAVQQVHPNDRIVPQEQQHFVDEFEPVCNEALLPNNVEFTQYHLRSVVRHLGTSYQCGHYITDVVTQDKENKNVWKRHDDQYVSTIADSVATNDRAQQNAYIFFYVHQSALSRDDDSEL
eukprot:443210_1